MHYLVDIHRCAELILNYSYTEVRFASFLSGGFTTVIVINPPERKLAKHTSIHYIFLNILINYHNIIKLSFKPEDKY